MINIDIVATAIAVLTLFGIYSLMAISLNLEYGVAGVPNFGKALFVSIGAYTAGITYTRLLPLLARFEVIHPCGPTMGGALQLRSEIMATQPIAGFINLGLTMLIAAVIAGAVGFALSYVTLRLKEEWFLALVLLVGGELCASSCAAPTISSARTMASPAWRSPSISLMIRGTARCSSCCWRWRWR